MEIREHYPKSTPQRRAGKPSVRVYLTGREGCPMKKTTVEQSKPVRLKREA